MTTNYVITGVWFQENRKGSDHISHVMLHPLQNNTILTGRRTDKNAVVNLLRTNGIYTVKWNYRNGSWDWGAEVRIETVNGIHYLRTRPDGDVTNNLDNLINMNVFPY